MSPFEYIMITGSIVLGLAIAQLLTGFADSIRLRDNIVPYTPHTLWALAQLLACIQWGFGAWIYETRTLWTGYQLLLFICTPILSFIIARITYPHPIENYPLKEHYYATHKLMFGLACAMMVLSIFSNTLLSGDFLFSASNAFSVLIAAIFLVLALSRNERVHKVLLSIILIIVFSIAAVTGVSQDIDIL